MTLRERIESLVKDHSDFVWRNVRRLGVLDGDADDITQRVFLTAARKIDAIEPGKERAFLYSVAVREASHVRRSYRRRGEEPTGGRLEEKSTGAPRPDEQADRENAKRAIARVLAEMDDDLRSVFVLFEIEELTAAEIGEMLAIPLGTVKSRLRRAREVFLDRTSTLTAGRA